MRTVILVCLCAALLCSCVGVESGLLIRNDGSGTLTLEYRISRSAADLGRTPDKDAPVPLPVEKADFLRAIAGIPGVRLARYTRRADEENVSIHAEIAFKRLEELAKVPSLRDAGLSFVESGGTRTLTQVVAGAPESPPTAESLAMIDSLFAGGSVTVVLKTPAPMTSGPIGTLSADRRMLAWTATIGDLARRTGSVVLTATW
ncbi:MAG: hypothetical protein NTU62_09035 [Spirochaetes bacterium]|nr:hypothetical protein [Spirochaetota bacterium]